jgi:hypothetical protein
VQEILSRIKQLQSKLEIDPEVEDRLKEKVTFLSNFSLPPLPNISVWKVRPNYFYRGCCLALEEFL